MYERERPPRNPYILDEAETSSEDDTEQEEEEDVNQEHREEGKYIACTICRIRALICST